jgi:hypothetical protein
MNCNVEDMHLNTYFNLLRWNTSVLCNNLVYAVQ